MEWTERGNKHLFYFNTTDYEAQCRKLGEKDKEIADVRESGEVKLESLKKDLMLLQAEREQDGKSLERNLKLAQ